MERPAAMLVREVIGHNSWATLRLLDFCRDLDPRELSVSSPGTFGSIADTLAHIVGTEEVLAQIADGIPASGPLPRFTTLDDLVGRARRLAARWERRLEHEPHPERVVEGERRDRRMVRMGTVITQVVHHGNHHRSQVCTVLSTVSIDPPALDGWAYAAWQVERSDRLRRLG